MRCSIVFAAGAMAVSEKAQANPIRRVVSLLQGLQEKVEAEGKRATKLLAKFECFCETNEKELAASIESQGEAITRLESDLEASKNAKKQVDAEVVQHKEDRENAKSAIDEAEKMRAKEASDFAAESGDMKANVDAMNQAIPAIEKGMAGSFLQTPRAAQVSRLAEYSSTLSDGQKQYITQFMQGGSGYAPASGQIVGILKQMKEEMEGNLAEITKTENEAIASHNGMMDAKNKEISAATEGIETKTGRSGELAVEAVNLAADLKGSVKNKAADENYLVGLKADCKKGKADEEAAQKERGEELVAIADTIKLLNSDEALELFKKTLPSPSLLQIQTTSRETAQRALAVLRSVKRSPQTDLIMLALQGKNAGFEQVVTMMDKMIAGLKKEQVDDDEKVAFCHEEIHKTEQQGKELDNHLSSLAARIGAANDDVNQYKSEIEALDKGIKELDKAAADATEQRKDEHDAYVSEAADNNAALQLLGMAKNRLNKFYHPEEYKEPPKVEKSEEERIEEAYSFIQVHGADAPADAPELAGHKKSNTGGVVGLMDMLIQDLKKEIQASEFQEKEAQEDYETFIADSKAKRAEDKASKQEKESILADSEAELLDLKGTQRDRMGEAQANSEYLSKVHVDCDWVMENYDARKAARVEEIESMTKAEEICNGADFSFVQVSSKPTLLTKSREQSCAASDTEHRRMIQSKFAFLQGFCEDMCKAVGKHPDCSVCEGFVYDATPGVMTWDELYAQFDKLKLVGRDQIKEWTGDAGKFGR
jgi:septal ring factor EnvC (AmiA/AmiB activator)